MIVKTSGNDPLATKAASLRKNLRAKFGMGSGLSDESALLLDISGSMGDWCAPNKTKIQEMRTLADEFVDVRRFTFSTTCAEMQKNERIGGTEGGTGLHVAFLHVKSKGIRHVVLITDGQPDDERMALQTSQGLKVDCFYVGPDPAPIFLRKLSDATGGTYGKASMASLGALKASVRECLQLTDGKGVIAL